MMASGSANSASTSNSEHAWFVDSGTSHHMTSHQEWFRDLRTLDRPGYIETGDDTPHPIRQIDDVPFGKEGNQTCIINVLHVPTITKKNWFRSAKLWIKACKFASTTKVASSRKMADS